MPPRRPDHATDPPIPPAMLDRLVLRWRRHAPGSGQGAHLRRWQGHSLEFRDYRAWHRGDDIRTVDWRASARQPRRGELLARSFEAEQRMRLAVVIDNRPEMALPEAMPKLLYGLWALRALTRLALDKGDEVVLARLFDGPAEPALTLRGAAGEAAARGWAERIWRGPQEAGPAEDFAPLDALADRLRPAGAVVVISDMLFEDPEGIFRRFARRAQERRRSLSVLQLDTLLHETAMLRAAREFRLLRPGQEAEDGLHLFEEAAFRNAAEAVGTHVDALRAAIRRGGLDWAAEPVSWPPEAPQDGTAALKSLFVRTFPRLPLLAGLSFGGRE